jgi:hypothetical protein
LKKEIKVDTRRWKHLPYSWIGRINIVKMAILPKAMYKFSVMLIKIPMSFLAEMKKINPKFTWKNKRHQIPEAILYKKSNAGGITKLHLKLYYRAIVTKKHGTGTKTGTRTNRTEDQEIKPQKYSHLIFHKGSKDIWTKHNLLNKWYWENLLFICRRLKLTLIPHPVQKSTLSG